MPIDYVPGLPPVPTGMTAFDLTILREQLQEDTVQILLKYIDDRTAALGLVDGDRNYWETHIQDWGAVADGTFNAGVYTGTDNTPFIQNAIDHAIYTGFTKVIVDPGKYRTTRALHLGYGESFHGVVIEGSNYQFNAFGDIFCGAAILADLHNEMAINVQGARGSTIRGIAIIGKFSKWVYDNTFCIVGSPPLLDDTDPANWDGDDTFWGEVGATAVIDAQFAPFAGITIDAYSGNRPVIHYPDVTYPASLGALAQYNKAFSSDVLIEHCQISGFIVGIANQPCDADGNGDFTCIRRLNLDSCKWGISVGNTQSRNVSIMDVKYALVHTMLINWKHGHQTGKFNGAIINLSGGAAIQAFDFAGTSVTGPIEFTNLYCEAHWRLGTCTLATAAESSIRFKASLASFELQDDIRGIPAYCFDGGQQPADVVMAGCAWVNYRSVFNCQHRVIADGVLFFNQEYATAAVLAPYEQFATNFLCGGFLRPPVVPGSDVQDKIHFSMWDLDTGVRSFNSQTGPSYRLTERNRCIPNYVRSCMPRNDNYRVEDIVPRQSGYAVSKAVAAGFFSAITLVNRTLTMTCVTLPQYLAHQYGLLQGDIIWDQSTGTVFFIRSVSGFGAGAVIIAEQQNNYRDDGAGGWECLDPFDPAEDDYLYFMNTRLYCPEYTLEGSQSTATAIITNAGRADGYSGYIESSIKVGDALFINTVRDYRFPEDLGFVVARSDAGKTITLSGNAKYTADRLIYPFWIRTGPANRAIR